MKGKPEGNRYTPQELKVAMERVWHERRKLNSNHQPARWVTSWHHLTFNTGGYLLPIEEPKDEGRSQ